MATTVYAPRFWYSGKQEDLGSSSITLNYKCELKPRDVDSDAENPPYEDNFNQYWNFYSEYYQDGEWYSVDSASYSSSSTKVETTISLSVRQGCWNRIYCEGLIYYDYNYLGSEGGVPTWKWHRYCIVGSYDKSDDEYSYGDVSINTSKNSSFIKTSGKKLYAYTKNNKVKNDFWTDSNGYVPATGNYIDDHITVANTNDWLDQLGIWSSWKHQADHYSWTWYDSGISMRGVTVPNLNTSSTSDTVTIYTQSSGTDITGAWFRSCGNGCGLTVSTIKGLSDEGVAAENATHIKASHFTDLADKVTTWT